MDVFYTQDWYGLFVFVNKVFYSQVYLFLLAIFLDGILRGCYKNIDISILSYDLVEFNGTLVMS